ncbi:MAG: CHAD domain-containing protein [Desulfopila sp.]
MQSYRIPPQLDLAEILTRLGEVFTVSQSGERPVDELYHDTFDWRLFQAGLMSWRQGSHFILAERQGREQARATVRGRKKKLFWRDFRQDGCREALRPLLKERALVPQLVRSGSRRDFNILNEDQKTVVRLTLWVTTCQRADQRAVLPSVVTLVPLTGYRRAAGQVRELLTALGLGAIDGDGDPVAMIQEALAIDPNETSSKFALELAPQETVARAVQIICLELRRTMMINVDGVLADIDPEFLHDLRVAVRRTRSLLALLKKHLPSEEMARFRPEFKWLGTVSGPVRDLDVYLQKEQSFRALLPGELQDGLDGFFAELKRRRRNELKKLRVHLRSERFTALIADWQEALRVLPDMAEYPEGRRLCRTVSEQIVAKRLTRLLRRGGAITPQTAAKTLHELRIEGKKFRYLLDFFGSLFDRQAVDSYLKQMKELQNVLGDFNDLAVQRRMLLGRLRQLRPDQEQDLLTAAALGGLIGRLFAEQKLVRDRFETTFATFASAENVALAEEMLQDPEDKSARQ